MYVHPDAEVRFVNNMAKDLGGGLYVRDSGEITVARNSSLMNGLADCFIQSYSPRSVEAFHSTQVSNSSVWVSSDVIGVSYVHTYILYIVYTHIRML